jgi:hypothetical protein
MELGAYGHEEWHTLYCHINHSCDITSFYDEKGECILSFGDTEHPNIFDVMNRLVSPKKETFGDELEDGIEYWNETDHNLFEK